jgi:hypothetical protein
MGTVVAIGLLEMSKESGLIAGRTRSALLSQYVFDFAVAAGGCFQSVWIGLPVDLAAWRWWHKQVINQPMVHPVPMASACNTRGGGRTCKA